MMRQMWAKGGSAMATRRLGGHGREGVDLVLHFFVEGLFAIGRAAMKMSLSFYCLGENCSELPLASP